MNEECSGNIPHALEETESPSSSPAKESELRSPSPPIVESSLMDHDDFHSALEQNVLQEFNNVHFTSKNLTQKPMCKETAFESWKSKQEIVYGSLVDSYTANQNLCGLCKAISGYGIIKCKDCCNYLCFSCDRKRHSYDPSHQRMYFKTDSSFKSLLPTEFITSRGEVVEQRVHVPLFPLPICTECDSRETSCLIASSKICYVVTRKGRLDLNLPVFHCQNCEKSTFPTVEDYISSGFWPGTPERFTVLFHQDVLEFWHHLRLLTKNVVSIMLRVVFSIATKNKTI
ncbi:hypothetical protein OUZ56_004209 [Daphnia magna]|uniref:CxC3 like cysteine cluster domain-containing protein n=2 Tax=Daphnia magna TaxID=35525 RepID=A0ABQ9YP39_9CRUS|nr:hypothetical protein OUZ56_004209 [Daphnia magna]